MTTRERFDEQVYPDPNSGCFIWCGCRSSKGYGNFLLDGKRTGAHRVAWLLAHGAIPTGAHVLHKCDTPACVNPDHLFLGTNQENQEDKARKGRGRRGALPFGVIRRAGAFEARVNFRGRRLYAGRHSSAAEASAAALLLRQRLG
jgi:hypothetical protein